jgi:hypothetical protein
LLDCLALLRDKLKYLEPEEAKTTAKEMYERNRRA